MKNREFAFYWAACYCFTLSLLLAGCSTLSENTEPTKEGANGASYEESLGLYDIESEEDLNDPIEPVNRAMFQFNDFLYEHAIRPLATLYDKTMPDPARKGIRNAFKNARYPVRAANSTLQGRWHTLYQESEHFLVNSTVGVLGFMKPSKRLLQPIKSTANTEQTLSSWGMSEGFYLFLPVFGPSTGRGAIGQVGDTLLDPLTYLGNDGWKYGMSGTENLNAVSFRLGDYNSLKRSAIDPYTAFKNAYWQNISKRYKSNQPE